MAGFRPRSLKLPKRGIMLTSQRILPVLIVFGVFAIPSVAKAQTNTTTVTISDPAANSPYKAGDPVFVTGTTNPTAYYVTVGDDKGTADAQAINTANSGFTTKESDQVHSTYTAPNVNAANTKVTISVKAYDNMGRYVGVKTVVILVSP